MIYKTECVNVHAVHSYAETFKHKLYIKSTSIKKDPNLQGQRNHLQLTRNMPFGKAAFGQGARTNITNPTQLSSIAEVNSVGEHDVESI